MTSSAEHEQVVATNANSADAKETPINIRRALERLRQERETFDQRQRQDARWFQLRMTMGGLAVLIIPTLIVICVVFISDPHQSAAVKSLAASALLVDILGLVAAVWKVVLNPASLTQLSPVTESSAEVAPSEPGAIGATSSGV